MDVYCLAMEKSLQIYSDQLMLLSFASASLFHICLLWVNAHLA